MRSLENIGWTMRRCLRWSSPSALARPLPASGRSRSKKRPFSKLRAWVTVTSWTSFAEVTTYMGMVPRSTRTMSPCSRSDFRNPRGSRHSFRACPRSGTAPGARGTVRGSAVCNPTDTGEVLCSRQCVALGSALRAPCGLVLREISPLGLQQRESAPSGRSNRPGEGTWRQVGSCAGEFTADLAA